MPVNLMTGTARDTINIRTGSTQNSGVCSPTTSQQIGNLDNIISRLERIEAVLSALLGGNVSANQLSDISPAAGVVTDMIATASNEAGGWVTDGTFTGVAISTLGWKLPGPNGTLLDWPIVTMENGVLNYGMTRQGSTGSSGSTGTGTGPRAGIVISHMKTGGPTTLYNVGGTLSFTAGSGNLIGTVNALSPGWYCCNMRVLYVSNNASEVPMIEARTPTTDPSFAAGMPYFGYVRHPQDAPTLLLELSVQMSRWAYSAGPGPSFKFWHNSIYYVNSHVEVIHFG